MTPILATTSLGIGLLVGALVLGLRHGIDWDHIAAITDLSATQDSPRRGVVLGTLYAVGHGIVVLAIGSVAIVVGKRLPESADELFGRIVGWTLILLGVYVVYSLVAHRGAFRMQSRWMLVIGAVRRLVARFKRRERRVEHDHAHAAFELHHGQDDAPPRPGTLVHAHPHTHGPDEIAGRLGSGASFGIGMLHGVGAETPTQVVIFLAAAQAGGSGAGIAVLVVFLIGLFASNTAITLASAYGFRSARRRQGFQLVLGAVTAVVSLVVGVLFALGRDAVLPAFFGG